MTMMTQAAKIASKAAGKVARMIRRAIISQSDANYQLNADGFGDEQFDRVELWAPFGFSSRPPAGGEVLIALIDAQGQQPIAFAGSDRRFRNSAALGEGDTEIFAQSTTNRCFIRLEATTGDIEISAASGSQIGINSDIQIDEDIGFYGTSPGGKPTVVGSKGGNAALASLLTGLDGLGLINDASS